MRATVVVSMGTVYLTVAVLLLATAQPHEDALILFRYAQNVARGCGVVYFPGGARAEGATDFLWMVALAGASGLGVDVAIAAAALNAAGLGLAAWLLGRGVGEARARWPYVVAIALLAGTPAAAAGWLGFSAMLFSATALALLHLFRAGARGATLAIPVVALLLALMRPDGALLGVGFAALGAWRARRGGWLARYVAIAVGCAAAGLAYFGWRWSYFGLALPLPLYVKSHTPLLLPGLDESLDWLASSVAPLALPLAVARVAFGPLHAEERAVHLAGLAPFALHGVALLFAVPTQNVADRFEAPATLALFYSVVTAASARDARAEIRGVRALGVRRAAWVASLAIGCVPVFRISLAALEGAWTPSYVTSVAHGFAAIAGRHTRLALTEAGELAFWTDAATLDLVGLDSPETARAPPTGELLDRFQPDVVMLHPAATLDEGCFAAGAPGRLLRIDAPLAPCVRDWARRFFRTDLPPYAEVREMNIVVAAAATAAWLDGARDRYDLYAARFESRFHHYHLYALRRACPERDELLRALEAAEAGYGWRPYLGLVAPPTRRSYSSSSFPLASW